MTFNNIVIPKSNGQGWTLNFNNPLSIVILAVFLLLIIVIFRKRLVSAILLALDYVKSSKTDKE